MNRGDSHRETLLFTPVIAILVWAAGVAYAQPQTDSRHINYDTCLVDSIVRNGERDTFTFDGAAGDKIIGRMCRTAGGYYPKLGLFDSNDTMVAGASGDPYNVGIVDFVLPSTGTYTLYASARDNNTTFDYSVSLFCRQHLTAHGEAVSYDTCLYRSLSAIGDMKAYVFSGNAGDKIIGRMYRTGGAGYNPKLELFDSNDTMVASASGDPYNVGIVDFVLPSTGTYTLYASARDNNTTFDYSLSLRLVYPPRQVDTISYGTTVSSRISRLDEFDAFAFAGDSGDAVVARLWAWWWNGPRLELLDPHGATVVAAEGGGHDVRLDTVRLPTAGMSILFVSDRDGNDTGVYALSLQRTRAPGQAVSMLYGDSLSEFLSSRIEMDAYTFEGNPGDTAVVRMSSAEVTSHLEVYDPSGRRILSKGLGRTLPAVPKHSTATSVPRAGAAIRHKAANAAALAKQGPISLQAGASRPSAREAHPDVGLSPSDVATVECTVDVAVPGQYTILAMDNTGFNTGAYDIVLQGRHNHDVGVDSILWPPQRVGVGATGKPLVAVRNLGRSAETFPVVLRIGADYADTAVATLSIGACDTPQFRQWQATQHGTFVVSCSTMLAGDQYPRNDRKTQTVAVGTGLQIYSITPNRGGDVGFVTVQIVGTGFEPAMLAKLTKSGHSPVLMDTAWLDADSGRVITAFYLAAVPKGSWNLVLANSAGDSAVFYDGFTVENGAQDVRVDIVGRSQIRVGLEETYWIRYVNAGNVDECVKLRVSVSPGAEIVTRMSASPCGKRQPELLGVVHADRSEVQGPIQGPQSIGFFGYLPAHCPSAALQIGFIAGQSVNPMSLTAGYTCLPWPPPPWPAPPPPPEPVHPLAGATYGPVATTFLQNGFDIDNDPPALWDALEDAFTDLFKPSLGAELHTSYEVSCTTAKRVIDHSAELGVEFPDPEQIMSEKPPELESNFEDQIQVECSTRKEIQAVTSRDPNDKAGPAGFGTEGYVPEYEPFQYVVYFENVDTATAPAETVVVTDTLSAYLDWTTFKYDTASHRPTSVVFDSAHGVATVRFAGIHLPPNKHPPEGEGWLSYTINPKPGLASGTTIKNRAWIVFDQNAPMATREVLNTIDAGPPTSRVASMRDHQPLTNFPLAVGGADDQNGSGIRDYAIYVSDNDSAYYLWKQTDSASTVFSGQNGHTYKLYSIATDNVGHTEVTKTIPDVTTTVQLPTGVEVSPNPFVPAYGHKAISFFGAGLTGAEIKVFNKAGELVKTIKAAETEGKGRYDWNARSENGKSLASGIYVYVATEKSGTKIKGKFGIIR